MKRSFSGLLMTVMMVSAACAAPAPQSHREAYRTLQAGAAADLGRRTLDLGEQRQAGQGGELEAEWLSTEPAPGVLRHGEGLAL